MPNAMYVEQSLSRQYRREYNFFSIDLVQIRGNSIEMTELPNLEQIHSKLSEFRFVPEISSVKLHLIVY